MNLAAQKVKTAMVGLVSIVAVACLAFMMLMTVADVTLRAVNPNWRIFGMLDYVEFSMDWLVFLAIPLSVAAGQIIVVDIVDLFVRGRSLKIFGALVTLGVAVMIGFHTITPALEILEWRERTFDLNILKFYYWIPIWIGFALLVLAAFAEIWGTRK
jgi:TRAP-type C4-dicarboxylate transport system permease small subunit